jgi:hypothetical protein
MNISKKRMPSLSLNKLMQVDPTEQKLNSIEVSGLVPNKNVSFYAVIRSKGGSGERHLINKLVNELPHKKIFLCYETSLTIFGDNLDCFYSKPINKLLELNDINESSGGIINLNWRVRSELQRLLSKINEIDKECIVIFSTGTSSGAVIADRVSYISHLCKRVFISVDSLVEDSVKPAKNLCFNNDIDLQKVSFGCWKKELRNNRFEHLFSCICVEEMKISSFEDIQQKVIDSDVRHINP